MLGRVWLSQTIDTFSLFSMVSVSNGLYYYYYYNHHHYKHLIILLLIQRPSRAHLKNMTPEDQELVINQFGTSVDYRHSGSRGISEFSSIGAPDLSTGDSSEPQSR